jgi:sulfate transport system ATP-binding protein
VRKELRVWLRRLHDELAISTIFVTHDQEEALDVADRIVVMNRGRVEQTGSPQGVYDDPRTPFVYAFLGAANRFDGRFGPQGFVAEGARAPFAAGGIGIAARQGAQAAAAAQAFVRPHDLEIHPQRLARTDGIDAQVRRVIVRGASVRVELTGQAGPLEAELERDAWHALGLREGDGVTVVPKSWRAFALPQ